MFASEGRGLEERRRGEIRFHKQDLHFTKKPAAQSWDSPYLIGKWERPVQWDFVQQHSQIIMQRSWQPERCVLACTLASLTHHVRVLLSQQALLLYCLGSKPTYGASRFNSRSATAATDLASTTWNCSFLRPVLAQPWALTSQWL